jgi:hypothetical protein
MNLTEIDQVKYVVLVDGVRVGIPQPSQRLAELYLLSLPLAEQERATIVPINESGKQLLLG